MTNSAVRVATFDELDTRTLYALLKLRVDVFVVEQKCAYPELDDRDQEPGTRHIWLPELPALPALPAVPAVPAQGGTPLAYLRLLHDPDGSLRVGRVVTAPQARGRGLTSHLMTAALEIIGTRPSHLDAQTQVVAMYEKYGYRVAGDEFVEDGILHTPMTRPACP
jgi:Predicted acyltransferase